MTSRRQTVHYDKTYLVFNNVLKCFLLEQNKNKWYVVWNTFLGYFSYLPYSHFELFLKFSFFSMVDKILFVGWWKKQEIEIVCRATMEKDVCFMWQPDMDRLVQQSCIKIKILSVCQYKWSVIGNIIDHYISASCL